MTNNRFRGYFKHSVDSKGRVAIPTTYRQILPVKTKNELLLNKGRDNTIEVHPLIEWEKFEKDILLKLSRFQTDTLRIRRLLQVNVVMVKIDFQGRILLPSQYKQYARIEGEAIISGVGNYFEIWNPDNFDNYLKQANDHFLSDLENIGKYLEMSKNLNIAELNNDGK
ncbi:MAG: division/cell wall cluster transcriptional repressor MraZ [Candidatus Latescibacteria bacterium]|nr:division/cell wall cluster transcriptional repressor MraZ [Candidatus Latescibacterota bacterium]